MSNTVRRYHLNISPAASDEECTAIYTLLKDTGVMLNFAYRKRSDSYSFDRTNELSYIEIITSSDLEDTCVHKVIADNPVFSKSTLTIIS